MKTCNKCLTERPTEDFLKRSYKKNTMGKLYELNSCRVCWLEYARDYRVRNAKKIRAKLDIKREKLREQSREYANRPEVKAHRKAYSSANPHIRRQAVNKWTKNNRAKQLTHVRVYQAIKNGKLKKLPCQVCGKEKSEAHHDDYSRPLDVKWFCRAHHAEYHRLHPEIGK